MIRTPVLLSAIAAIVAFSGCARGDQPAAIDTRNDSCTHCRMTVSDIRFAAQIVAPQEEPRFFDDIGCLRSYVERATISADTVIYVADHRTKSWIAAERALYVRNERVQTPMASHLLAFADASSRDADPVAQGTRLNARDLFGSALPADRRGDRR